MVDRVEGISPAGVSGQASPAASPPAEPPAPANESEPEAGPEVVEENPKGTLVDTQA